MGTVHSPGTGSSLHLDINDFRVIIKVISEQGRFPGRKMAECTISREINSNRTFRDSFPGPSCPGPHGPGKKWSWKVVWPQR